MPGKTAAKYSHGMQRPSQYPIAAALLWAAVSLHAQTSEPVPAGPAGQATAGGAAPAPLPDVRTFLLDVERNATRMDELRKEYTYHVHLEEQTLDKKGSLKKSEVLDSESLTVRGIRVDRLVARNGQPLTPAEQAKENERIDKEVAKAQEREAKAASHGQETNDHGDTILSVTRILELGTFSNERRVNLDGRPTIVLDYAGDPSAKTRSQPELIIRDLVGTLWVDEADRAIAKAEMHFVNDFKIGGGLVADVHKGTGLNFQARRVGESVWLPANINGQGSIRLLLFAGLNGRMNVSTSDYRRFHTSATVLAGEREVDANGNPLPAAPSTAPGTSPGTQGSSPEVKPQQ